MAKMCEIINNPAADCSILPIFVTEFDHVTPDVSNYYKRSRFRRFHAVTLISELAQRSRSQRENVVCIDRQIIDLF